MEKPNQKVTTIHLCLHMKYCKIVVSIERKFFEGNILQILSEIKARKDNCYLENDYPWNGLGQVVTCSKFVLAQRFFSKYLEWVYRASTRFR